MPPFLKCKPSSSFFKYNINYFILVLKSNMCHINETWNLTREGFLSLVLGPYREHRPETTGLLTSSRFLENAGWGTVWDKGLRWLQPWIPTKSALQGSALVWHSFQSVLAPVGLHRKPCGPGRIASLMIQRHLVRGFQ